MILSNFYYVRKKNSFSVCKIYDKFWYENEFLSFIENNEDDNILFLLPQLVKPFYSLSDKELNDFLIKNKKKITFYVGGLRVSYKPINFSNLKFIFWDSIIYFNYYFSKIKNNNSLSFNKKDKFNLFVDISPIDSFKYYFYQELNKNLNLKEHKSIFFNFLNKEDDKEKEMEFINNSYDQEKIYFNYKHTNIKNNYAKYAENPFVIICEDTIDYFFVTEKVIKAIYFKKPFLVLGCHKFHFLLKNKYKFQLFDEIIDYSFDNIIENSKRINMFVNEIKKINENYSSKKIHKLTLEKTERNYFVLTEILKKEWPEKKLSNIFFNNKDEDILKIDSLNE